jgi:hypothetical protein
MIRSYSKLLFVLFLFIGFSGNAATFYSRNSGNWTNASTWSTVACGSTAAFSTPGAGDNVVICAGNTVTMNGNPANCLSLTINGTASWSSSRVINIGTGGLIMNPGSSVTGLGGPNSGTINVAGTFTVNAGGTSTFSRGTLNVSGTTNILGTFAITNASGTKSFQDININGGTFASNANETYTINGNVVLTNGTITGTSTGIFNIAGTLTVAAGTSTMGAGTLTVTGTTTINGTLNESSATGTKSFTNIIINSGAIWNNLSAETYSVSGTLTMNGGTITGTSTGSYNITGGFIVAAGTNTLGQSLMNVTGASAINSTLNITNVTGTKTFGDLSISSTGGWNCAVAEDFRINGNFTNNGVFTANTGIYQLAGAAKIISGTSASSFTNLNNTGSYTNNGIVEVTNSHYGGGSFSQGGTGSYFQKMLSANFIVTTFNASAVGNIVTYNLTGAQNVRVPSDGRYYHLTTAGSGIKTLLAATIVGGNFIISSGTTFDVNNLNMSVAGNFTNNGFFTAGTATVILNGTLLQTIDGTTITAYRNLTISNAAGIALSLNTSVSGVLNFTAGVITTAANKVTITSTGSVTGAGTSRFVNGFLEKNVATGSGIIRNFEIGNGTTNYLPVSLNFASVTSAGNVTANVSNTDHASITSSCIDELKSVNHYWTLSNSGTVFTTYSAACTFIGAPTDADAGSVAANYYMSVYSGGAWTILTRGTVSGTVNEGTGIFALGDLQVGERRTPAIPVQPVSVTVCDSTAASFSLTVVGVGLSYQWQENNGGGFVDVVDGGIYSGATTPSLSISPASNGMNGYLYQCVISNTCGTVIVVSNSVTLTVTPSVMASSSVTAAPSDTICAGTNVTFTALNLNGGASPVYDWYLNGVNVSSGSTTYSNSTLNDGDQVYFILTSNAQCVLGSPYTSNVVSMVVYPNLPVTASIAASSTSICPGTPVTFTATPTNGGTLPSYQWSLNGVNVGSDSVADTNSALVNGDVITCVLTSNAICPTGNPATSNSIVITVNPFLPVSVSISPSPSDTICDGTVVLFTASPVNGGAAPAYQWQLNGVNVGSNSATYSNNTLVNSDIVSCILSSTATCATGSPDTSNAVTMVVNANMPLSITISANPSNVICAGDTVTFTGIPVNGGGLESYQWQVNGSNVGSNSAVYTSTSLANGDNVVCLLSSTATCATGSPASSNTITMTVNAIAPVSVSVSPSPAGPICTGTSVTFTATPVNGGTLPSYQWQLNGVNVGANSTTYTDAALVNGDVITCILTSNAACANGSPATSAGINMVVNPTLPVSVTIAEAPVSPVCSGTLVTFTAAPTNEGAAPVYQWQLNGVNVGASSSVYSNAGLSNGDVVQCILTSNIACPLNNPDSSNSITMSVLVAGGWTGTSSSDWNTASNWCGGVPIVSSNVSIVSGTPFSPSLSNASNCNNISIGAGAFLNLNNNILNVYGALSGAGFITGSSSSSVNFAAGAGSGGTLNMDQSVPGATNTLIDLSLNRAGSSVTLGNVLNLTGTVGISSGTLNTGGNLVLVSNAAGTARVGSLAAGADVSGNVTMQRYIPGGTDGWMFIASPVTGATLLSWDDDFITGGFPGSFYPPSPNPSIVTYNEGLPGIYDDGYVAPGSINDAIVGKKGYWAYIMATPLTLDVTGPLIKNNQAFSITYTDDVAQPASEDGWNLVANPYPSTIDWDAPGWTKTNINDAIYMYSPTLEQYTSYVGGIGTNGGSNLIASSQAFLVQAASSGAVLSLTEAVKDATDGLFIRAPHRTSADDLVKLNFTGNGYSDETIIHFNAGATDNFDLSYDALKFFSFNTDVPGIGSVLDTALLSVNTFPLLSGDKIIPIKIRVGISGNYAISLDAVSRLPESSCVLLEDLLTGVTTDLRTTASVSFYVFDTTLFPRFRLKISNPLQTSVTSLTCNGNNDGMAVIAGNGSGPWDYTWTNSSGNIVQSHLSYNTADTLQNAAAGTYNVTVNGNSGFCTSNNYSFVISVLDSIEASVTITNASCSGSPDGSILINSVNGGSTPYTFNWSNGGNTQDNLNISTGAYILSITDSTGCIQQLEYSVGQTSSLSAQFTASNDTVYVSEDNEELVEFSAGSKLITSYLWDFGDGSPLSTSPNPSHLYTVAGTYTVTLIASDGNCSDTSSQVVVIFVSVWTGIDGMNNFGQISFGTNNSTTEIMFHLDKLTEVTMEVYNSLGQQIFESRKLKVKDETIVYDFNNSPAGIYYIKVQPLGRDAILKKIVR